MSDPQHLQQQLEEKMQQKGLSGIRPERESSSSVSESPRHSRSTSRRKSKFNGILRKNTKVKAESESSALFTSESEEDIEIHPAFYEEFVCHEDLTDEVERLKEDLRFEILEEARLMMQTTTAAIVTQQVDQA